MKSFRLSEFVCDTGERCSPSESSQLEPTISVKNCAVLCDSEWLLKGALTLLGECRQLAGWNRKMVSNVTGVRVEFVQATSYELAASEETAIAICGFHVFLH
jgi:hypothetical protein